MGSVRELLVAACHAWTRGVHVGADGTRLAHAQFLGEPAVRREQPDGVSPDRPRGSGFKFFSELLDEGVIRAAVMTKGAAVLTDGDRRALAGGGARQLRLPYPGAIFTSAMRPGRTRRGNCRRGVFETIGAASSFEATLGDKLAAIAKNVVTGHGYEPYPALFSRTVPWSDKPVLPSSVPPCFLGTMCSIWSFATGDCASVSSQYSHWFPAR